MSAANKEILATVSRKEAGLLALVRAGTYCMIEIHIKDGEIAQVYAEEEISPAGARVEDIVQSNTYQTVIMKTHAGDLVNIRRRIPVKPLEVGGLSTDSGTAVKKH